MTRELQQFLVEHENDDITTLLLKQKEIAGYPATYVADQINGRRKAKDKLPLWYKNLEVAYPPQQNLEQCSSEITARFKASFIRNQSTHRLKQLIDLTGGFGVDTIIFSQVVENVIHVEPNETLSTIAKENSKILGSSNIDFEIATAENFLNSFTQKADWIFIDPSRKINGKKVFRLSDCEPDVGQLLPLIWSKTDQILIKTAPLLDLKEGLKQLSCVSKVCVLAVQNECKEVLFFLQKDCKAEPQIETINIIASGSERFLFKFSEEENSHSTYSDPKLYLYEPNTAILKAGAFKLIGNQFQLNKIEKNTHLYTSEQYRPDFPGRVFKITGKIDDANKFLPDGKANIIARNHPLSPDGIKKKFKIKDGGQHYVLAFSGTKKKFILIAERLQ